MGNKICQKKLNRTNTAEMCSVCMW